MSSKFKYHLPFIFLCIVIFIESSFPSDAYPNLDFELSDKLIHLGLYLVLFFVTYFSFSNQKSFVLLNRFPLFMSFLFTTIYGASDEIHQYFVKGRTCDFYDWVADTIGALIALLIIYYFKKSRSEKNNSINTAYDTNK